MRGRDDNFNGKNVMGREPSSQLMCVNGIDEVANPEEDWPFNVHIDYNNYEIQLGVKEVELQDGRPHTPLNLAYSGGAITLGHVETKDDGSRGVDNIINEGCKVAFPHTDWVNQAGTN
ncbi:hypothetical protein LIER_07561 [Lithospermum erythrorhizon]|uniref:Uncharacterized protein n=1 Tax=Lithospermum erythrorhizon TaxID=34254 RepID=A0AAV3P9A4_LITER